MAKINRFIKKQNTAQKRNEDKIFEASGCDKKLCFFYRILKYFVATLD